MPFFFAVNLIIKDKLQIGCVAWGGEKLGTCSKVVDKKPL